MKKVEFMDIFTALLWSQKEYTEFDKPAISMKFHNKKDMYHRGGLLTDSQVQNWIITQKEWAQIRRIYK